MAKNAKRTGIAIEDRATAILNGCNVRNVILVFLKHEELFTVRGFRGGKTEDETIHSAPQDRG